MKRILAGLFFLCCTCLAQAPRILIVTDLEGAGGVNDPEEQLLPGQRRYLEARHILLGEVNAAVEGALAAGAGEIVIWDGHDGSRTLSVDEIHSQAKLIQGRPTPANYYLSEKLYDGIMFIGQHAMAGAKNGVLAHSQSFAMRRISINGTDVGEIGQLAAIAGYFGIPVIMLAGDQAACAEVQGLQPQAVTVAVKRLVGKGSTLSLSHTEAKRQIREAAQRAVSHAKEYKPWKIAGPVEMVFENHPQPPQQPVGRTTTYRGQTVLEAYEAWLGKP
ncbi:MAG TPA: M55 family metallopeptidase [Bryobacteraceae bacterium]|nr:M55 family metallopeptidase [Bryobacteraceae bacterium]